MSYRNARLANGFLSLDKLAKELDLVKSRRVSDSGAGVERIVRFIDCSDCSIDGRPKWLLEEEATATKRQRKFHAAEMKLHRAGLGYLVPTLALICRNGKYRDESMREFAARQNLGWEAAKRLYFSHREKIGKIFLAQ